MARGKQQREREAFHRLLRQARHDAGLTQAELASALGRHQSYVSKYERGEVAVDVLELRAICAAVGISLPTLSRRLERALE